MDLERWRVVQLTVTLGTAREFGSGYLVRRDLVLTCAHIVAARNPEQVEVRFSSADPPRAHTAATQIWRDEDGDTDMALVRIPPVESSRYLDGTRYARLAPSGEQVGARAVGYPQWKVRHSASGTSFREFADVRGRIRLQTGPRTGGLELVLDDAAPGTDEPHPWDGMSGAPVWVAGRIVGLVAEHHPDEGGGRLTVRPLSRVYLLALAERDRVVDLLRLPSRLEDLQDAIGLVQPEGGRPAPTATFDFVLRRPQWVRIPIDRGTDYVIGRHEGCDIRTADTRASGMHARVWSSFDESGQPILQITDLRSRNGTRVNGRLMDSATPVRLRAGDVIVIGGDAFAVEDNRLPE